MIEQPIVPPSPLNSLCGLVSFSPFFLQGFSLRSHHHPCLCPDLNRGHLINQLPVIHSSSSRKPSLSARGHTLLS